MYQINKVENLLSVIATVCKYPVFDQKSMENRLNAGNKLTSLIVYAGFDHLVVEIAPRSSYLLSNE